VSSLRVVASILAVATVLTMVLAVFECSAAATLEPEHPALGERALLRLESAPADSTDYPVGLNAAVRPTEDPRVFEFVALRVGEVGVVLPATSDTLRFAISGTIEEPQPGLLRPLHSVGELGPNWATAILIALVLLAGLGALLLWWLRRRGAGEAQQGPPPEPAHVVALRDLERLEADRLVQDGRFDEFYVRGSHIIREYASRRFELPVLDWTTIETLDALQSTEAAQPQISIVAPLLRAADEVKFARHEPIAGDGVHWLRKARDYVQLTLQVEQPDAADNADDPGSGDAGPSDPIVEPST